MNPVTVALCNDYDVVVHGLEAMLAPFSDRIKVVELNVDTETVTPVDVTLYDTFAHYQPHGDSADMDRLITNPANGRVVIYTWNIQPQLVQIALARGCAGYLDKASSGEELAEAIEWIVAGEVVIPRPDAAGAGQVRGTWPGQQHGLSAREAEILALITQGMTNEDIAARAYLSINTVKSYIRTAYRKIGVARRSHAVRWGMENGMLPDHQRQLRRPLRSLSSMPGLLVVQTSGSHPLRDGRGGDRHGSGDGFVWKDLGPRLTPLPVDGPSAGHGGEGRLRAASSRGAAPPSNTN